MKKHYFLFLIVFLPAIGNAQTINFPDIDFKNALLGIPSGTTCAFGPSQNNIVVDVNGNGEIEQSEALAVYQIVLSQNTAINDITGIEYFTNLRDLYVDSTPNTTLNATTLVNLRNVSCNDSFLTTLDLSHCMQLETLHCQSNQLTSLLMPDTGTIWLLDCSNNLLTSLSVNFFGDPVAPSHFSCRNNLLTQVDVRGQFYDMDFAYNQLTTLDLSHCQIQFYPAAFDNNPPLVAVNLKDGVDQFSWQPQIPFGSLPNLQYLCVDDVEVDELQSYINSVGQAEHVHINSYCTFEPGGSYASITGHVRYDSDGNGCDASDPDASGIRFHVTDEFESTESTYYSGANGQYAIDLVASYFSIMPMVEHPEYFTITPSFFSEFISGTENIVHDICIAPNGTHHNVSIEILPLSAVRPGVPETYKVMYHNIGNTVESGTVTYNYDEALTDFSTASLAPATQSPGQLSWNYSALQPFEMRSIDVTLNINTPGSVPPVDSGTVLSCNASITATNDEELFNNSALLQQTAVNSLDPNDKTCLEGTTVTPAVVGDYVHYMIRFENTGTANALNVVVTDQIDTAKFDLSSLVPLSSSHSFKTRIKNNNVEFFFEDINLPFDDANNDGYIAFKIKTIPELVVGDSFSNTANIYFDFNAPIVTNTATTNIAVLAVKDFEFSDYFTVYPNPAENVLNLHTKGNISVASINIYNALGQLVLTIPNADKVSVIDISQLKTGNYFIKINSDKGTSNSKFIKK